MRTLADIIIEKIKEKNDATTGIDGSNNNIPETAPQNIPSKVVEVFTALGKMLSHFKSGKLPKALKMLPHLKNWEVHI
jgi:essential nuclear protein 1